MDWDAISAVCDVLGTVAVVVSLLYVARQFRQTPPIPAPPSSRRWSASRRGWCWVSENPARMAVLRKCVDGLGGMTPDERFTIYGMLTSWFAGLENAAYFKEAGICHDAVYQQQERIALMILGTRVGRNSGAMAATWWVPT